MPVPRRFDRSLPERDSTRINDRIRVPEVRLIGSDGEQVGIVKTNEALRYAQDRELDLVEVAPGAKPPVCRVLDYSKYKYEQAQRQKAARKHQQQITVREIKFRPKIAQHDYDTKKGHVERFLKAKDKVKVTIMFRGREVAHPERGEMILNRLAEELEELASVDQRPIVDGRNMTMLLAPLKGKDESDISQPTKATAGKDSRRTRRNEADTGEHEVVGGDEQEPAPETAEEASEAAPETVEETSEAAPETVEEANEAAAAAAEPQAGETPTEAGPVTAVEPQSGETPTEAGTAPETGDAPARPKPKAKSKPAGAAKTAAKPKAAAGDKAPAKARSAKAKPAAAKSAGGDGKAAAQAADGDGKPAPARKPAAKKPAAKKAPARS